MASLAWAYGHVKHPVVKRATSPWWTREEGCRISYHRRGIAIYREVFAGKSIIGKNRRVDLLLVCERTSQAYALECKYQGSQGTADEKTPYALEDSLALRMGACLVYAGAGWSDGVLHLLRASPFAAHCLPPASGAATRELDHILAIHFAWWDVPTRGKQPFVDASPGLAISLVRTLPPV